MTMMPTRATLQPATLGLEQIAAIAAHRFTILAADLDAAAIQQVDEAVELLERVMPNRRYQDVPETVTALGAGIRNFPQLLAAHLLSHVDLRATTHRIPDAVVPELGIEAMRILRQEDSSIEDDVFRKDLSICLLLSFPCVAQVVEQTGGIPLRALTTGGIGQAARMVRHLTATGWRKGPYLEIHTHTPMLPGFTPKGWDQCYMLVAELLKQRPDCLGMVGGSWFYDPALAEVSPRLRYLAETPIDGGAFRVRLGTSEEDAELATATSATRRTLVEEGKYVPTRWLLIWPRKALLNWAAARAGAGQ